MLQAGVTGYEGNDIVITETEDGAMVDSETGYYDIDGEWEGNGWFSLTLPAGITWDGVPDVKITDGDLEIDDIEVDMDEILTVILTSLTSW